VDAVSTYTTTTASGLQIIYDTSATFTCTGATVILTGGTGSSATNVERVIVDCTATGIMVDNAFSTTPSTDTTYSIGAIKSYYQTKDYDLGDASLWKSLTDLFLWAKEQGSVTLDLAYKADFAGTVASTTISQDGGGGLWGTAVWGTAIWGGQSALLERVKLLGECRYVNFKITENDIDEGFDLYGWNILFIPRKHY